MASRDDFPFGRFWDLPVSESNIATTPKACTSQLVIRAVLARATESSCGATALTWHRDLGYWGLFLAADPHTEHFYARWDALRIGEKTCPAFPGRKLPVMGYSLVDRIS